MNLQDKMREEQDGDVKADTQEQPGGKSVEWQILFGINTLLEQVAVLQKVVEEHLPNDRVREEAFNRLYAEVEEVRQERSFQHMRPLLMDLILLSDRLESSLQYLERKDQSEVVQLLKSFRDEVLEILYRRGVEVIRVGSATFDRSLQQALRFQPTAIAEEHNQVARVVRRGFHYGQRILRFEEVIVNTYKAKE